MLTVENAAAALIMVSLCAYTVFGGADFGSGVWVLLATSPRGGPQRRALFRAMGPVWETNHIWLILTVVALFTTFPIAFAALFTVLLVPLTVALVGITFRGAAFAFHHYGDEGTSQLPATEQVFAVSSLLTPLALGVCVGAVATGGIQVAADGGATGDIGSWLAPFPLLCGVIAVAMCAQLTAAYMTVRTAGELREDFRGRALAATLAVGALTTAALPLGRATGSFFVAHLAGVALLPMTAAVLLGLTSLAVLWWRRYWAAPVAAAATCCMVLLTWGAAQYPYLVPPTLRIADAAAPRSTLVAFLIAMVGGLTFLGPSLLLLLHVLARGRADLDPVEH